MSSQMIISNALRAYTNLFFYTDQFWINALTFAVLHTIVLNDAFLSEILKVLGEMAFLSRANIVPCQNLY